MILGNEGACISKLYVANNKRKSAYIGQFILVEGLTNQTIGCGIIELLLYYFANIIWQRYYPCNSRESKGQKPCTVRYCAHKA